MLRTPILVSASVLLIASAVSAQSADWPQWRGPARDGLSTETGLLQSWPEGGPTRLWKVDELGGGYSAPAIAGGLLYASSYRGDDEVVWALDAKTGEARWSTKVAGAYHEMEYPEGPRATPCIDGGQLFTLGAGGNLVCLDAKEGKLAWSTDLRGDLAGEMMSDWGYSESPLVDGELVLCTPGGAQGCVAALDRKSGEVVWRSKGLTDPASYSSLVKAEFAGRAQYIVVTGLSVAGISAEDGELLWSVERVGKTAVVPTPIFLEDHVWVTSGYGVGCNLIALAEADGAIEATMAYKNRTIKNDQGGALLIGDHVYASSGPLLVCMEWRTGKTAWRSRSLNRASLGYADGNLIVRGEQGQVALVEANPAEYVEKGSFEEEGRSSEAKSWTHPIVWDGKLYLRDQGSLSCYDLKPSE